MLEWLRELDPEDRQRAVKEAFNKVAATEDGVLVFHTILGDCNLFAKTEDEKDQALSNYGKFLLGYFDDDSALRVTENLLRERMLS